MASGTRFRDGGSHATTRLGWAKLYSRYYTERELGLV